MDVVPDASLEDGGFTALPLGHGTALQTIHHPKLLIQEMSNVRVEPVDQREAMVFPGVILLSTARGFCNHKKEACGTFPGRGAGDFRMQQNSIGLLWGRLCHKPQHPSSGSFFCFHEGDVKKSAALGGRYHQSPPSPNPTRAGPLSELSFPTWAFCKSSCARSRLHRHLCDHPLPMRRGKGRHQPRLLPTREQEPHLDSEYLRLILITPGKVLVSKVRVLHVACKVGGTSDFPIGICERGEPCRQVSDAQLL